MAGRVRERYAGGRAAADLIASGATRSTYARVSLFTIFPRLLLAAIHTAKLRRIGQRMTSRHHDPTSRPVSAAAARRRQTHPDRKSCVRQVTSVFRLRRAK